MEMQEERLISAPPATVWAALFDPEVLKASVPGCEELTGSRDEGFEATVKQKVGPVKATFKGNVTLSDIVEGESCTLSGEGKGGAAGFARGEARIRLTPEGDGTRLSYEVDAKVGGKLAQLGSRIIDGFAKRMAEQFFSRFQEAVEGPQPAQAENSAPAEPEVEQSAPDAPAEKKGWFRKLMG